MEWAKVRIIFAIAALASLALAGGAALTTEEVPCRTATVTEYWCCNVPGGRGIASDCSWMSRWPIDWCGDSASEAAMVAWCERSHPGCGCRCTEIPYVTFDSYQCSAGPYRPCGRTATLTCIEGQKPLMCINAVTVAMASKCGCPEGQERDGTKETCRAKTAPPTATPAPAASPAPGTTPTPSPTPRPAASPSPTPSPTPADLGPLRNATAGVEAFALADIGGLELDAIRAPAVSAAPLGNLGVACTGQTYKNMAEYLSAMAGAFDAVAAHYDAIAADLAVAEDGFAQQCRLCASAVQQVKAMGLGECDERLGASALSPEKVASGSVGPVLCHEAAQKRCEMRELKDCRPPGERAVSAAGGSGTAAAATTSASTGGKLLLPIAGMVASEVRNYAGDTGADIHVPMGTPVQAVAAGTLVYSERGHTPWTTPPDTPNSVLLKLDSPITVKGKTYYYAWYTHLRDLAFRVPDGSAGRHVAAGTGLGTVGKGNNVAHLHFGILTDRAQGEGQYMLPDEIKDYYFGSGAGGPGEPAPSRTPSPTPAARSTVEVSDRVSCPLCASVPCSAGADCSTEDRAVITAPAMLAECQQALIELGDACTVDGSDVVSGTALDPCAMQTHVASERARVALSVAAVRSASRSLRSMASDLERSMRDGLPPQDMDRRISSLVASLSSAGNSSASTGRAQNEFSALISLLGTPLLRDVGGDAAVAMVRRSDSLGYLDTGAITGYTSAYGASYLGYGSSSAHYPTSASYYPSTQYSTGASPTPQPTPSPSAAAASSAAATTDPRLMSARVGYRGDEAWSKYCGRFSVAGSAASSSAAGSSPQTSSGSTPATGGGKTFGALSSATASIVAEAPTSSCGRPRGRCESELVAGARLWPSNVDAWTQQHLQALAALAALDPQRLFLDVSSCFRYAADALNQRYDPATLTQCSEACEACFGTRASHCHPQLALCMCHTASGNHAIDLSCTVTVGADAIAMAQQCCSRGLAGNDVGIATGRRGASSLGSLGSSSGDPLAACHTPSSASGATFDLCSSKRSETGLCCVEGLKESPVSQKECKEREEELPCEDRCVEDEEEGRALRECLKACDEGNATKENATAPSPTPTPTPSPQPNATSNGTANATLLCKRGCLVDEATDAKVALRCMRACGGGSACEDGCERSRPDPVLLRPCLEGCVGWGDGSANVSCAEGCAIKFGAGSSSLATCVERCGEVNGTCEEGCLADASGLAPTERTALLRSCLAGCGASPECMKGCRSRFAGQPAALGSCEEGCAAANATALCIENCTRSGGDGGRCIRLCKALAQGIAVSDAAILRGLDPVRTAYVNESVRVRAVVNDTGDYAFTGRAVVRRRRIAACTCPPCPAGYECGCACDEETAVLAERPITLLAGASWAYLSDPIALEEVLANATIQPSVEVLDEEGRTVARGEGELVHVLPMGPLTVTDASFADAATGSEATTGNPGSSVSGRVRISSRSFPVRVEAYLVIGERQEVLGTRASKAVVAPSDDLSLSTLPLTLTDEHVGWVLHIGVRGTDGAGRTILDTVLGEQGFDASRCAGRVMTSWCVDERSRVRLGYPRAFLEVRRPQARVAEAVFLDAAGAATSTAGPGEPVSFEVRVRNMENAPFTGRVDARARSEDGADVAGSRAETTVAGLARGGDVTLRSPRFAAFPTASEPAAVLHVTARDEGGVVWLDEDVDPVLFPFARLARSDEGAGAASGPRGAIDTTFIVGDCRIQAKCEGCLPSCELRIERGACTLATRSCGCACATRRE